MMEKSCKNCKFQTAPGYERQSDKPCFSCKGIEVPGEPDYFTHFQPRKPRRKELQAQLDDLQKRYDALQSCYAQHEEPDGHGGMVVDFGKVLVEHDELLTKANAEIESMHNELAAKEREIAEHRRHVATVMQREADLKVIVATQERELDEVKAEPSNITAAIVWDGKIVGVGINGEPFVREDELDEALATCTDLADDVSEWKALYRGEAAK